MHNSKFNAGMASWLWLMIWTWAITIFTFGIAYPWALCAQYGWQVNNLKVNGYQMRFDGQGHQLIGMWIKWWFFTLITFGIYALWVPIKLIQWKAVHTFMPEIEAHLAQQAQAQQPVAYATPVIAAAPEAAQ